MSVQIPIGLRGSEFIHISEADRGEDCGCVCTECGLPLVAKKGQEREYHFAHSNTTTGHTCAGGVETALHRYAKQIIEEALYLEVPSFVARLPPPDDDMQTEIGAKRMIFTRVAIEESMSFGGRRVDVAGYMPEGRLLIEIHVTHRVRGQKLKEVRASDETMLEIELPQSLLYSRLSKGEGSLRAAILDSLDNKHWLYHPEGEIARESLKKQARERRLLPKSPHRPSVVSLRQAPKPVPVVPKHDTPGHLPSRDAHSPEEYVRRLAQFLDSAGYDVKTKRNVINALCRTGNITDQDVEIASRMGFSLGADGSSQ